MKNNETGTTVPGKKEGTRVTSSATEGIEMHAESIWHTVELLDNQHSEDGVTVTLSRDALRQCCKSIGAHLCHIVEAVESPGVVK